ncbi:hypothetical protein E4T43_06165 [Aureobasidium subglaciale]|nr:hypothetical protein E4T43_06165 [Aureobasidium subglaciale]
MQYLILLINVFSPPSNQVAASLGFLQATTAAMLHPQDIDMPDYDYAFDNTGAVALAEAVGGDTDGDTDMSESPESSISSPAGPLSPPADPTLPLYNSNPPHSFDIPANHLIDLTSELTRPGGPLPILGPYFDIDIKQTLDMMFQRLQQNGQRFYRLKYAINYLSQGFYPTCKYPGCTSRCRIVDHELDILTWKSLQSGGENYLRYVTSDKEHAAFLSVSCSHDNWTPSFMWKTRVVGFMPDPVAETQTFERWTTPAYFYNRHRDSENFPVVRLLLSPATLVFLPWIVAFILLHGVCI